MYLEEQLKVDSLASHPTLKAAHSIFCVLHEACDLNMFSRFINLITF